MIVITIGRNPDCNIVVNGTEVSRRHAILKVFPTGKCEIVGLGPNGTSVNGNPITPNQPYPLKRGDDVIFANQARLDWSKVPNPLKPLKIGAIVCAVIAVAIIAVLIINNISSRSNVYEGGSTPVDMVVTDSVNTDKDTEPVNDNASEAILERGGAVTVSSDSEAEMEEEEFDPIAEEFNRIAKEHQRKKSEKAKTKSKTGKVSDAKKEVKEAIEKAEDAKNAAEQKAEEVKKPEAPAPSEPAAKEADVPSIRF